VFKVYTVITSVTFTTNLSVSLVLSLAYAAVAQPLHRGIRCCVKESETTFELVYRAAVSKFSKITVVTEILQEALLLQRDRVTWSAYTGWPKKPHTILLSISLLNIDRFS